MTAANLIYWFFFSSSLPSSTLRHCLPHQRKFFDAHFSYCFFMQLPVRLFSPLLKHKVYRHPFSIHDFFVVFSEARRAVWLCALNICHYILFSLFFVLINFKLDHAGTVVLVITWKDAYNFSKSNASQFQFHHLLRVLTLRFFMIWRCAFFLHIHILMSLFFFSSFTT